jgi:hypothetical protein
MTDQRGSITKDANPTGINQYSGGGGKKGAAPATKSGAAKEPATVRPAGEGKGHAIPAKPEGGKSEGHGGKAHGRLTGEHVLRLKGDVPISAKGAASAQSKQADAITQKAQEASERARQGDKDRGINGGRHSDAAAYHAQAAAAHAKAAVMHGKAGNVSAKNAHEQLAGEHKTAAAHHEKKMNP